MCSTVQKIRFGIVSKQPWWKHTKCITNTLILWLIVFMTHIKDIDDRMRWTCLLIHIFNTISQHDKFIHTMTPPTISIRAVLSRQEYVNCCWQLLKRNGPHGLDYFWRVLKFFVMDYILYLRNTHAKLWYLMDLAILLVFGIRFYVMDMVRVIHGVISYRYVCIVSGHIERCSLWRVSP